MKRFGRVLRQSDFQLFAFLAGFLSLNWPFLSVFEGRSPETLILYFYAQWALVIVLLSCIVRSLGRGNGVPSESERE